MVNNLVSHNIRDRGVTSIVLEGNLEEADPSLLIDASGGDLHLDPTAMGAIDLGVTSVASEVTDDIDSELRDAAPDIGADEVVE